MKAVITVIGKDKPGIIAAVSALMAKNNVNIEDISQTVLQGNFTMIMLVSLQGALVSLASLKDQADELSENIGVTIRVQNEEIFDAVNKI
jgi:ACT domain-containing protein